ncbi:MAG: DUF2313 domain-containing protein [Thermoplasmatales archaeon]|nr:MAG: DUF2313 domain-containing protein [Thermoplasmatales archaeon]
MSIKITNSDETQATVNYLRNDKLFRAKNIPNSNLRKLFVGLALEIARSENILQEISNQYDPLKTTKLIEEWEKALGIPDACIPIKNTIDERREFILLKLRSLGVSTKEGFEDLGLLLGFNITVTAGQDSLTFPFTFPFILTDLNPRWIMYVSGDSSFTGGVFPYTFPFTFGADKTEILRCLFQKLAPTPVKVIFNFS